VSGRWAAREGAVTAPAERGLGGEVTQ